MSEPQNPPVSRDSMPGHDITSKDIRSGILKWRMLENFGFQTAKFGSRKKRCEGGSGLGDYRGKNINDVFVILGHKFFFQNIRAKMITTID